MLIKLLLIQLKKTKVAWNTLNTISVWNTFEPVLYNTILNNISVWENIISSGNHI